MKNFKQSRTLAFLLQQQQHSTPRTTNTSKWPSTTAFAASSTTKRNIVTIIGQNSIPNLLEKDGRRATLKTSSTKKNQSQIAAIADQLSFGSSSGSIQEYNYSTTTHVPRGASSIHSLKQNSQQDHHSTIIATTIMSNEQQHQHPTTHQHDGKCCGGAHQTKKKVSGIGIKKKQSSATSSTSSLECTHQIDYSQLSANNQNPNLSRPEPSDPTVSYTIEGLLQKKPAGINAAVQQFEEEFTEEELAAQQSYEKLLNNNKEFVKDKLGTDPDFFNRIKDVQKPDYMLIGCSDSRVPPDQLTKTQPGQIFIHRNVANLVVNTDVNAMSVLQYAVEVLQVKHVIVMGHTRCGGVMAALTNKHLGLIDHWLRNIKDVYRLHKAEVDAIEDKDKKIHRMIELNIIEQTLNLCKTSVVQNAWAKGKTLHVHGWLCDIETGLIKDLEIEEKRWKEIENIYKYDFDI